MSYLLLGSVFKLVFEAKSSKKFFFGAIFSFSFSMAVILCTIGLMDGFEFTLKETLSSANGDIKMTSRKGFFVSNEILKKEMEKIDGVSVYTPVLQIESFALTEEGSKGVLIKGVYQRDFERVTGMSFNKVTSGIVIGSEFAKKFGLKRGDYLTLAMASSKSKNQGAAILEELEIQDIVKHGIFEKDMRFIYMDKTKLEELLNYKAGVTNLALFKIETYQNILQMIETLKMSSLKHFRFEPFWSEFEVLLDAVKIEKRSISMVLQLIVLVAILNIVAFIIYISEVKSQEFFMLRAFGLSAKQLQRFWFMMLILIWGVSSFLCIGFKELFAYLLGVIPFLKIPGDIYVLSELKVILDPLDYLYVYGISLVWVLVIGFFMMKKLSKSSVLSGLRQEFS